MNARLMDQPRAVLDLLAAALEEKYQPDADLPAGPGDPIRLAFKMGQLSVAAEVRRSIKAQEVRVKANGG